MLCRVPSASRVTLRSRASSFSMSPRLSALSTPQMTSRTPGPSTYDAGSVRSSDRRRITCEPSGSLKSVSSAVFATASRPKSVKKRVHRSRSSTPKMALCTPLMGMALLLSGVPGRARGEAGDLLRRGGMGIEQGPDIVRRFAAPEPAFRGDAEAGQVLECGLGALHRAVDAVGIDEAEIKLRARLQAQIAKRGEEDVVGTRDRHRHVDVGDRTRNGLAERVGERHHARRVLRLNEVL